MVKASLSMKLQAVRPTFGLAGREVWLSGWEWVARSLRRAVALVQEWRQRARSRVDLADMSFRGLQDIGLTPDEVQREVRKLFWQA
jgi:uncharacterized protein YjiS (DUF1127 family)